MHPMEPVELCGGLIEIEPLAERHAEGILGAADCDEVFAWLPYPRPEDLADAQACGSWRDSVHYSILRAEWPQAKGLLMKRLGSEAS